MAKVTTFNFSSITREIENVMKSRAKDLALKLTKEYEERFKTEMIGIAADIALQFTNNGYDMTTSMTLVIPTKDGE